MNSAQSGNLVISADTNFYAFYGTANKDVTVYYPTSTTARSSTTYYRNEVFTSASSMTGYVNTDATATSNFTFTSSVSGYSLYGFGLATGSNTRTYNNVAALGNSDATTVYAILRKGKTATVCRSFGLLSQNRS